MPSLAESPLLQIRSLATEYPGESGPVRAVNNVTLDVNRGEIVGIVGETGCGKSTLARSIIRLVEFPGRITGGSIVLDGWGNLLDLDARKLRKVRGAQVGYISQNPFSALNPVLRIGAQFRNVLRAHGRVSTSEAHTRSLDVLSAVGIPRPESVLAGYAHQLSGGMAQRVVIALAIVLNPPLVIADEPTTGLDVTIQRQILDLIRELAKRSDRGTLLVTHDLGVVAQYCDRVAVMYAGSVVETGLVGHVFARPGHPYTSGLLAAIPQPGRLLRPLAGSVIDLEQLPVGCAFAARCPHAFPRCLESPPPLVEVAPRQEAACFLPGGVWTHVARSA